MKKLTIILFSLAAACVVFFAFKKYQSKINAQKAPSTKTIIPAAFGSQQGAANGANANTEELTLTSLIPLLTDETLIATYSIDFDQDGYDDQIVAVKTPDSQFIKVIVGLYNSLFNTYERSVELVTDIEQVKTFSLSAMDITGTHENALIITGYSTKNESLFEAWLPRKFFNKLALHKIADLQAEGTIFVQQRKRSDSYPLESEDGESFPIWAYTSDPGAAAGSLDQLQIMYDWSKAEEKYVQKVRSKIAGKRITAQELAKIQDGTESTFASFLNGLWVKPAETTEQSWFLFFDYDKKEIIFFQKDRQEIYMWGRSTLRRNGILVYTTNKSMTNISRRFDIALISTDEIRIKVTDDLGILINSETLWDGSYKKQNSSAFFTGLVQKTEDSEDDAVKILQTENRSVWKCSNGWNISFTQSSYKAKNGSLSENGVYTELNTLNEKLLQFKSAKQNSSFSGFYRAEIIKPQSGTQTGSPSIRISLSPVTVNALSIENAAGPVLYLEAVSQKE
ncbi:MAG: pallilysin-related adhesin [Treponema lecithinolyticum]|uniref:pallilysin-related adhesin n=1 Tax=Treponema lecithinolyticum TaxID=53418 RepID=UPI00361456FB